MDHANKPNSRASRNAPAARLFAALFLLACIGLSCGQGTSNNNPVGPPPSGHNSLSLVVDAGPIDPGTGFPTNYVNGGFVTVTVCAPGTANCQAIDHVLVDTGSYGLRLLASGSAALSVQLPRQTNSSMSVIAECAPFAASIIWGPVATADVKIAGETASSVPIQIIGDPTYPDTTIPASCSSSGLPANDTLSSLGSNGILGVGVFTDDCGPGCADTNLSNNPGWYYACSAPASCSITAEPEASQLLNPAPLFSSDNNGVVIQMPGVGSGGAQTATGTLTFGIGTATNNTLSGTVFPVDGFGNFIASYNGTQYPNSYIDSGSGAFFFLDSAITGITECVNFSGYYCPGSPKNQSVTAIGSGGSPSKPVNFSIANAESLLCNTCVNTAFSNLGGVNSNSVDLGMPFIYGQKLFVGFDGFSVPSGGPTGPFWAF